MINESLKNAFKQMWKNNLNLLDISREELNSELSLHLNDYNPHNISINTIGAASYDHTHHYAGSSSVGGSAASAVKLDTTTAGDSNTPVYFSEGKPVPCTSLDLNTSGNAATATALTTSAGSATNPIYFSNGKPAACTYTLGKSVPSDANFTDTVYTHPTSSGNKHIPSGGSSG